MAVKKSPNSKKVNKPQSNNAQNNNGSRQGGSIKLEVISLIIIGISLLVIISVFSGNGQNPADFSNNAIGFLGGFICWVFKGLFGIGAYVLPFGAIALCSSVFFSENKKIKISKFILGVSLFLVLISFMYLVGDSSNNSIGECFSKGGPLNGGFIGCIIGYSLYSIFGFGTYIIFAVLAIILSVMITGKSFMIFARKAFCNCYFKIKNLFEKDEPTYMQYDNDQEDFDEKKNDKFQKKSYLEKKKLQQSKKAVRIDIPENREKTNKNSISLIKKNKENINTNKNNMPSFLQKKDEQVFVTPNEQNVNTYENISDDDIFGENFKINGYVEEKEVHPTPTAQRSIFPSEMQQSFNYETFLSYEEYEKAYEQNQQNQQNLQNTTNQNFNTGFNNNYVYGDVDIPTQEISISQVSRNLSSAEYIESPEFQAKILEDFKERIRENMDYSYITDRSKVMEKLDMLADEDESSNLESFYEDYDQITDELDEINEFQFSKEQEDTQDFDDLDEINEFQFSKEQEDIQDFDEYDNNDDNQNNFDDEEIFDLSEDYESGSLEKTEDFDDFEEDSLTEEISETFSNDYKDEDYRETDDPEFLEDDYYYAQNGYISDGLEENESLQQAMLDYFEGDLGTTFKNEKFDDTEDLLDDDENYETQEKIARDALKTLNKPISTNDTTPLNKKITNFENHKENAISSTSEKQSTSEKPKIFQAEENELVSENIQEDIPKKEYVFPLLSFLEKNPVTPNKSSEEEILENSRVLVKTLKSFNVEAKVNEISKGPTVTRYELSPGEGIKVSKILGLADNLALSLAAKSIRIEAPIPGKAAVGIEIPNKEVTSVYLSEVICDPTFQDFKSNVAFGLGKDITGNVIVADIAKMPHMLVAGRTGSGKSVCINTLITSILYKSTPEEVKLIMIDPKVVELSVYNGIPHLLIPVVTEPEKAAGALNWAVAEMMSRYDLFAKTGVRSLKGYNSYCEENNMPKVPQIVIIIDELADLMMVASKEVEGAICRLAQLARAAGIHLVIATQRPSVDVITGLIKANIPSRIAFAVSSSTDSRTILDMGGADKLLGMGDMLFKSVSVDSDKPLRIQGAFISDKEVEKIVSFIKENNPIVYDESLIEKITSTTPNGGKSSGSSDGGSSDELTDEAIEFVVKKKGASASALQRRFNIGYNRASRIIEELEERGIVGPSTGTSKPRAVLMDRYEFEDYMQRRSEYI